MRKFTALFVASTWLWALPAWRSPQILRPPPLPRLLKQNDDAS